MNWQATLERYGWKASDVGGEPFTPLSQLTQQARQKGEAIARVSVSAGMAYDYGALKVSATVTLECPQTEHCVNLASETAFHKAIEVVRSGAHLIGIPEVSHDQRHVEG